MTNWTNASVEINAIHNVQMKAASLIMYKIGKHLSFCFCHTQTIYISFCSIFMMYICLEILCLHALGEV